MKKPFSRLFTELPASGFLLITCGLPGTGKTWASQEIARSTGCRVLRSDLIRRELFRDEDIFDARVAADATKRRQVYEAMFRQADEALEGERCLILDATFITHELRRRAADIAARQNKTFIILETVCPPETAIGRILSRDRDNYISNAITEEAYRNNERQFEPIDIKSLKKEFHGLKIVHITIDTSDGTPDDWHIIRTETG